MISTAGLSDQEDRGCRCRETRARKTASVVGNSP